MAFHLVRNGVSFKNVPGPIQGPLLMYDLTASCSKPVFSASSSLAAAGAAVVLFVFNRDGGAGDHVFGILDHGQ